MLLLIYRRSVFRTHGRFVFYRVLRLQGSFCYIFDSEFCILTMIRAFLQTFSGAQLLHCTALLLLPIRCSHFIFHSWLSDFCCSTLPMLFSMQHCLFLGYCRWAKDLLELCCYGPRTFIQHVIFTRLAFIVTIVYILSVCRRYHLLTVIFEKFEAVLSYY